MNREAPLCKLRATPVTRAGSRHIPTDPTLSGAEVEAMDLDTIRAAVESVHIPVAVKVGHAFTVFAHFAKQVEATGVRKRGGDAGGDELP